MVRHIVVWSFNDEFTPEQKRANAEMIRDEIRNLKNLIADISFIDVIIEALPTGNADLMLTSLFESEEALARYQVHPEHVRVAKTIITPLVKNKLVMDYHEV